MRTVNFNDRNSTNNRNDLLTKFLRNDHYIYTCIHGENYAAQQRVKQRESLRECSVCTSICFLFFLLFVNGFQSNFYSPTAIKEYKKKEIEKWIKRKKAKELWEMHLECIRACYLDREQAKESRDGREWDNTNRWDVRQHKKGWKMRWWVYLLKTQGKNHISVLVMIKLLCLK